MRSVGQGDWQFGVGAKVSIEFQEKKLSPRIKISATAGVGYDFEMGDASVFPTVHLGWLFFNTGTLASKLDEPWTRFRNNIFFNALATVKLDTRSVSFNRRYVPLYHFSDFTVNALQNPYKTSITFGAIKIIANRDIQKQRLGFVNFNIVNRLQLSYYNDGGPILKWFGDGRDRYYTGGVVLSYHGNTNTLADVIELSYHKFTGYVPNAFDVGEVLQIDYLIYKDVEQFKYNQQLWKLNFKNSDSGLGVHTALYDNNALDLQDWLHFLTHVPYHPDYYQRSRFALGGSYLYNLQNINK